MNALWRVAVIGLLLAFPAAAAAQDDPFNGSWRLNVAKSKFPQSQGARDEVVTFTIVGDVETFKADGHLANGAHDVFEYSASYSGKAGPSKTIVTEQGTTAMRKIDARTRERVSKVDGKVVLRARRVVSEDGTTLTSNIFGMENGKEVQRETRVFERRGAAQGDPFAGTWTLNVARSKFASAGAVKSETVTLKVAGDEETLHAVAILADDGEEVLDYRARYDGKEYPSTQVTTDNNMVTVRKVNVSTRERISRLNGRVVGVSRRVVSPDGKMLTTSIYRVDANGKETLTATRVFDRM